MSLTTMPHINTRGRTRELLEFYRTVFGGDVVIATYADIHAVETPEQADQIAFGQLEAPNGFRIAAYDVQPSKGYDPGTNPFYVVLRGTDPTETQHAWRGLADGASILTPMGGNPYSPNYGMLTDRFGVTWIVDATAA
jgi:PhnB protein